MEHLTISFPTEKKELLLALLQKLDFVQIDTHLEKENEWLKNKIQVLEEEILCLQEAQQEDFSAEEEQIYLQAIQASEKDIAEGKVISHEELLKQIQKW